MKTYYYTVFSKEFADALSAEKNLHISNIEAVQTGEYPAFQLEIKKGKLKESISFLSNFWDEYIIPYGKVIRRNSSYILSSHFKKTGNSDMDITIWRC